MYPFQTNNLIEACTRVSSWEIGSLLCFNPSLVYTFIKLNDDQQRHSFCEKITPVIALFEGVLAKEDSIDSDGYSKMPRRFRECLKILNDYGADMVVPRVLCNMVQKIIMPKYWKDLTIIGN